MVVLIIDGHPKAQPRPRAFARRFGDKVRARMYDEGTAENWKSLIALAARLHQPASPTAGPICLRLQFFMPRPKSRSRKCDPPGPIWCTSKPDAENLAKPVMDALTQLGWWVDDSQVVELHVTKRYHPIGGRPGAIIEIQPEEEPATQSPRGAGGGRHSTAPVQASRGPGMHSEVVGAAAPPLAAASAHSPTRKVTNEQ